MRESERESERVRESERERERERERDSKLGSNDTTHLPVPAYSMVPARGLV